MRPHPARFSKSILEYLDKVVPAGRVLDPFSGVGGIFALDNKWRKCWGVEIEHDWIDVDNPRHIQGNSKHLDRIFSLEAFDSVCTSPVYGSRMSDHHKAQDESKRHTYTHYIGHELADDNAGKMYAWDQAYWDLHLSVYIQCERVLRQGGLFFLNTKNFIRKGELVDITAAHSELLMGLGFTFLYAADYIKTPGQRHGANGALRVDHEVVQTFRKDYA